MEKPINKTGFPKGNRDTCDGECPRCGNFIVNITPRSKPTTICKYCGQEVYWR